MARKTIITCDWCESEFDHLSAEASILTYQPLSPTQSVRWVPGSPGNKVPPIAFGVAFGAANIVQFSGQVQLDICSLHCLGGVIAQLNKAGTHEATGKLQSGSILQTKLADGSINRS